MFTQKVRLFLFKGPILSRADRPCDDYANFLWKISPTVMRWTRDTFGSILLSFKGSSTAATPQGNGIVSCLARAFFLPLPCSRTVPRNDFFPPSGSFFYLVTYYLLLSRTSIYLTQCREAVECIVADTLVCVSWFGCTCIYILRFFANCRSGGFFWILVFSFWKTIPFFFFFAPDFLNAAAFLFFDFCSSSRFFFRGTFLMFPTAGLTCFLRYFVKASSLFLI